MMCLISPDAMQIFLFSLFEDSKYLHTQFLVMYFLGKGKLSSFLYVVMIQYHTMIKWLFH